MSFNDITIATAVGWALLTAAVSWRIGRPEPRMRHVLGAGSIAAFAAGAFALTYTRSHFGLAHLGYVTLTVGPAVLALIGLVAMLRGHIDTRPLNSAFLGALLVPGTIGLWATHVAPFSLEIDRVVVGVPCERSGDDPITIGVLADIQTPRITDYELDARDRLMAEKPDVILIAGDIQQGSDVNEELRGFRDFFAELDAPYGVFLADGDVDSPRVARLLIEGSATRLLFNETVTLEIGDRRIRIGANERDWLSDGSRDMVAELAAEDEGTYTIVLSHRPDIAIGLEGAVDLVVAGHTHGGQIALPVIGPLEVASDVPRSIGAGGLHDLDGQAIYVSSGVGMERGDAPQVRLFSPPSFGVLTLADDASCG